MERKGGSQEEEHWISYSPRYSYRDMVCPRCGGKLYEEYNPFIPEVYREFACLTCGFRFWIDTRTTKLDIKVRHSSDN